LAAAYPIAGPTTREQRRNPLVAGRRLVAQRILHRHCCPKQRNHGEPREDQAFGAHYHAAPHRFIA